jgi:hypothetical protein
VTLGGDGTISHVINNSGGKVTGGSTVTYLNAGP